MMSEIVKRFGERVKFYRVQRGMSQEKLAELCGLHPTYIGQVERGEKNCTLESAEKISKGLKIPIEKLLSKTVTIDEEKSCMDIVYDEMTKLSLNQRNAVSNIVSQLINVMNGTVDSAKEKINESSDS